MPFLGLSWFVTHPARRGQGIILTIYVDHCAKRTSARDALLSDDGTLDGAV